MTTSTARLSVLLLLALCQSCGATSPGESNARLSDLGNGICQQNNGIMWQVARSENFTSQEAAEEYADSLVIAGYSDWRLPTKMELYDLCDIYEMRMAGDCPLEPKGSYWSKNGKGKAGEWMAYPLCGGSDYKYLQSKKGRVRAVRP